MRDVLYLEDTLAALIYRPTEHICSIHTLLLLPALGCKCLHECAKNDKHHANDKRRLTSHYAANEDILGFGVAANSAETRYTPYATGSYTYDDEG